MRARPRGGPPRSFYHATSGGWWGEALDFLELSPSQLPPICPAGSVVGEILPQVADGLGLPRKIPVIVGTMDQVAVALAGGSLAEGVLLLSLGTVLAVGATALRNAFRDPLRRVSLPIRLPHPSLVRLLIFAYRRHWASYGSVKPSPWRPKVTLRQPAP